VFFLAESETDWGAVVVLLGFLGFIVGVVAFID